MSNARPTQPGYYWVRARGAVKWVPVEAWRSPSGALLWTFMGDEANYDMTDPEWEWGPAIPEYRGEGGG